MPGKQTARRNLRKDLDEEHARELQAEKSAAAPNLDLAKRERIRLQLALKGSPKKAAAVKATEAQLEERNRRHEAVAGMASMSARGKAFSWWTAVCGGNSNSVLASDELEQAALYERSQTSAGSRWRRCCCPSRHPGLALSQSNKQFDYSPTGLDVEAPV